MPPAPRRGSLATQHASRLPHPQEVIWPHRMIRSPSIRSSNLQQGLYVHLPV